MSLDAIKKISEAETAADAKRTAAQAEARQMVAKMEADGEAMIKAAREAAYEKTRLMALQARARGEQAAAQIRQRTALECENLDRTAAMRMDSAVKVITERIVND